MPPLWLIAPLLNGIAVGLAISVILSSRRRLRKLHRLRALYNSTPHPSSKPLLSASPLLTSSGGGAAGMTLKDILACVGSSPASSEFQKEFRTLLVSDAVVMTDQRFVKNPPPGYEETIDLLLIAAGYEKELLKKGDVGTKVGVVMTYNDSLQSSEEAKAWFQRALELTY